MDTRKHYRFFDAVYRGALGLLAGTTLLAPAVYADPAGAPPGSGPSASADVAVGRTRQVPAGARINVKLLHELRSDKAQVGDPVRVVVAGNDNSGLPAGSILVGRVTAIQPASRKEAGGIDIQFGAPVQSEESGERAPGAPTAGDPCAATCVDLASTHLVGEKPRSARRRRLVAPAGLGALLQIAFGGNALIGAATGGGTALITDEVRKRPGGNVRLKQGAAISVQFDRPLPLDTAMVASEKRSD